MNMFVFVLNLQKIDFFLLIWCHFDVTVLLFHPNVSRI